MRRQHERAKRVRGTTLYDGLMVQADPDSGMVLVGIGYDGEAPVAMVPVCPTEGIQALIAELQTAAAPLARVHALGACGGHPL